jgi:Uma2 family endonuclease
MSTLPKTFLTPEEYLEQERRAEFKSEYYNGETFAMAGASRRHGLIVVNMAAELRQQLKGKPCEVQSNDLRLRIPPGSFISYPDIMVICDKVQFTDDQQDTVVNPLLIIEVLSPSTRDYDRGLKFEMYRKIDSLREYLTVSQDSPHVEHWTRADHNHWELMEVEDPTATLELPSIGCILPLSEIYDKVVWE